jgi:protein phosphatase methylesterase 1
MSDLQRSFAKAKLATFPQPPVVYDEVEEEQADGIGELPEAVDDDSSSASSASSASSTGTIIPSSDQRLFARPQGFAALLTFNPKANRFIPQVT